MRNKVFLAILFLFIATKAFAVCDATLTVCPSGCDYTILNSAVTDLETNCASPTEALSITISGDWTSATDTTVVAISGITTSVANTLTIVTTGLARHDGKRYGSKASAHTLYTATNYRLLLYINNAYVIIDGLQVNNNATTTNTRSTVWLRGNYVTVKNCIVRSKQHGGSSFGDISNEGITGCKIYNNLLDNVIDDTGIVASGLNGNVQVYNNTIIIASTGGTGIIQEDQTNSYLIKNNLIISDSGSSCIGAGNAAEVTNGTSDATGAAGLTNLTTAEFVSVVGGSEDYHLASGATSIGAGTDLSGIFTTDIDGETRSVPWDISADKYVSSGFRIPTMTELRNVTIYGGTVQHLN